MRKTGILVIFVLFLNMAAYAQTVINIESARLLGLTNSRDIAGSDASIRTALLNERTHLYSMLPQVSAGYSTTMNFLETDNQGTHQFINPLDNVSSRINLTISQNFTLGGSDFVTKSINKIKTDIARISSLSTYYKVLESIDSAYYSVLRAADAFESAESSLRAANLALEIAEVRFNNGIINQIDYLEAQANRESSENTYNQNRRSHTLSMITLKDLLGVQGDIILEPVNFSMYDDVLRRLAVISNEDADVLYTNLWNAMLINNPSLKTAALNSQIDEMNYSTEIREYLPKLSLDLKVDNILSYSSAGGFGFPPAFSGSITFSGRIPIDLWNQSIKTENRERTRDNNINNYSDQLRSYQNTLLSNLYDVLSQAGSVLSSRRSLEIAQNRYDYQMERYRLSQSSVKDVGDASISLMNSQNSLNNANYTFLQRLSTLRSLCALDDEERLINILLGR
ncbi:MAG: TolC family protein [Treponema sp.]|jgi:outer membrane protein TolC|nr:TolC family protein [Treponema sp.]